MSFAQRPSLVPLDQALAQLLAEVQPLSTAECVPTLAADRRVLAQDVVSALQVPPADNSAMDGYAVNAAEVQSAISAGKNMVVSQRIAAGAEGTPLQPGTAARIFTGASVPMGADSIVMQEDCDYTPASNSTALLGFPPELGEIKLKSVPNVGQWIRRAGEDVRKASVVLKKGERLAPASLGLLASLGLDRLMVATQPRVALFSTGDELVMPGDVAPENMPAGAIYNSNRFFLKALLQRLGCVVSDFGIVPDNLAATKNVLQEAAHGHDLILTSGGVSVGEEDHIKPAVEALGRLNLWQIAIKPGKPFAYGQIAQAHFMGLPGNPVSSWITFLLLVRPFLLRLQGVPLADLSLARYAYQLPAHFDWPKADKRREFLRVRRNAQGGLDLFPNQSSGVLTSAVWADGMVDNSPQRCIAYGDAVTYISFADLLG